MNIILKYFKNLQEKEATKFLIIFYVVGILGFLIPQSNSIFTKMIALSLVINIFMLFLFHKPFDKKHVLFFGGVALFTIIVEAIGVHTGLLFGEYFYGKSLSLKVANTPILIGFNWLMLSYGVVALLRRNTFTRKYIPILGGLFMTFYDFIMEPVAMKTDMWSWSFNTIPLQNYVMWFVVSVIVISAYELFSIKTDNKIAQRIFILQLVFFGFLNLFLP